MRALFRLGAMSLAIAVSGAAHAATELTVASFPSFDRSVKAAIPLYKKIKPDIEIKLVSLAFGDHHNAMTTALATGANLPDVMAVEVSFIGKFVDSGGLEDLSKAPYNGMQYKDKLVKFTVPQTMGGSGNMAAMPADIGPGTLFYREDLVKKAGLTEADLTKSWDSYVASGKKLKEKTGAYLINHAVELMRILIRADLKDGEGIFFDAKHNTLVDTPRFEKAFKYAKQARDAGLDGKINAWSNEWAEGFRRGQLATQMSGAWLAGHYAEWLAPDTKGLWRSAQLPGGAFAFWGGSYYSIPKKAAHKAEAWDFIKFMCLDKGMQIEALRALDAFPALIEAQNDPFISEPMPFLGGQKARELWKVAANKIPAVAVDKYDPVADEIITAELEQVLEKGKDIKKALADAKAQVKRRVRR